MFDLIHADPPWRYSDVSRNRGGAERHYSTMSLDEMKRMNVADYANKNCYLFMWTTGPQLEDSIELMRSWGFAYCTFGFVWVKRTKNHWTNVAMRLRRAIRAMAGGRKEVKVSEVLKLITGELVITASKERWFWGMGSHTRANAEIVLIGRRGKPKRADKGVHQVLEELVAEHSVKPEEVYRRLEKLVGPDAIKLDMFTRNNRHGWSALGDQVGRTDFVIDPDTGAIVSAGGKVDSRATAKPKKQAA